METELLPCPFCGGENAYLWEIVAGWNVVCDNADCAVQGPVDFGESGAIAKWNTRATTVTVPILGTLDAATRIPQP